MFYFSIYVAIFFLILEPGVVSVLVVRVLALTNDRSPRFAHHSSAANHFADLPAPFGEPRLAAPLVPRGSELPPGASLHPGDENQTGNFCDFYCPEINDLKCIKMYRHHRHRYRHRHRHHHHHHHHHQHHHDHHHHHHHNH